jgi:hypothetical protein
MPGMCLVVVAVAAMLVVGRGSLAAMVEEAAMAVVEEVEDGQKLHPETWKLKFTIPRVNKHLASKKGFRQKRKVFLSIPLRSALLFLEVPAKKECSSFFFKPMFLRIPGNSGDSCRNAQPRGSLGILSPNSQSLGTVPRWGGLG